MYSLAYKTCVQVLKQMKAEGYVRSLAFDPEGTFLAALMADGTLAIWGVKDGRVELRKRMGPRVGYAVQVS